MCRENRLTLEHLLKDHSSKILGYDEDDTFRIKVQRRHIWEDSLHFLHLLSSIKYDHACMYV